MTTKTFAIKVAEAATGAITSDLYKDVKSSVFSPIAEVLDYERHMEINHERMKEEAKQLYAKRDDVQIKIINCDGEKEVTKACQVWIDKANKIQKEVEALESDYSKDNSFLSRSDISKRMVEKYNELHKCLEDVNTMEVLTKRPPRPVIELRAPKIEDKPSLYEVFKMITNYLLDVNVKRIGIWGMLGVGKTAIMKNLNNSEKIAKLFDIIIFATLPDDMNEGKLNVPENQLVREPFQLAKEKLQVEIAKRLKLNVEGITNTEIIASRISGRLKSKKYLLLLDNVWDVADLHEIGICDNQKDSKVVLASRHRDICKHMDVDEYVKVERLSNAEAISLFREKLGRSASNSDFEKVAKLVVRHCSNLPLLIDKVAGFFKKKDQKLWWSGVRSFQRWPYIRFPGMDEVLRLLRFCFEELVDKEKKLCFLYSSLHTECCEILTNYLVECCKAEGFIENVDMGQIIVDDLIDVSLLEIGEKKKYVRMNQVLRNMALKISSEFEDLKFLVRAGEGLQEPPTAKEWKGAKQISLMDNRLCSLPEQPDCTNLSTLLLQRNVTLTEIPLLFFTSMQNLRVLDLHGTEIKTLPSLSCLTLLRALYLNSCNQLTVLPADIKDLKHLEVLDIRGTRIYCLPVQIGFLQNLQCLRISFSSFNAQSEKVEEHQNVFSKLSSLEELVIEVDAHNQWWNNVVEDIAKEVAALGKLSYLSFCFPDMKCLEIFLAESLSWKQPWFTFQFFVNYHYSTRYMILDNFEYDFCRRLKYANGEGINQTILKLLSESDAFELIGHKGDFKLSDFGIERVNKLKTCLIEGCEEIKTIIDANGAIQGVLICLESIYIRKAAKLISLWEGPVPAESLAKLTVLILSKCPMLKKIFSRGMIQQPSKLQFLKIEECHEIEEIVMESENDGPEPNALPILTTLILNDLPKLRSIWKENSVKCPSLKSSKISNCPLLTSLPFN